MLINQRHENKVEEILSDRFSKKKRFMFDWRNFDAAYSSRVRGKTMTALSHRRPRRFGQEAGTRLAVGLGVAVDFRQQAARQGDVDFLGSAFETRYVDLHGGPHAIGAIGMGTVLGNGVGNGNFRAVFRQPFQM